MTTKAKATAAYKAEMMKWRQERDRSLRAPDGWLTLAGLFWLKEGANSVGADKLDDIVLPGGAPARVGEFEFHNGVTTFKAAAAVKVTLRGSRVSEATLQSDEGGSPDILQLGPISMMVIKRGARYGIRVKDSRSPYLKKFTGIRNFPINERYRVQAKFVSYHPPRKIAIPDILGDTEMAPAPGYVEFTLGGKSLRLVPVEEDGVLFFIFKDLTSGKQTYPPGRFLYAAAPKNGVVILDFNKAYNPPCAFTPYATCPLPPKENILPVAIRAGELRYGH